MGKLRNRGARVTTFFINESLILFFQQFDAILSSLEFVVLLFSPKQK